MHVRLEKAKKILNFYREYSRKKTQLVPIPKKYYQPNKVDGSDRFLFSDAFRKENKILFTYRAGMQTLVAGLNKGNYSLLRHYLQRGKDIVPLLLDAYFRGEREYPVSLDLVEMVAAINSAAEEFVGLTVAPKEKVNIFPIFNERGDWSEEAALYLFPHVENLFMLRASQKPLLQQHVRSLPRAEQFFAMIDLPQDVVLGAAAVLLNRCIKIAAENDVESFLYAVDMGRHLFNHLPSKYSDKLKDSLNAITRSFEEDKAFCRYFLPVQKIINDFKSVYSLMVVDNNSLINYDSYTKFYYQLIISTVPYVFPVPSSNSGVSIIVTSGKLLEIGARLMYGREQLPRRFVGFGIFSASEIAAASKADGRIINAAMSSQIRDMKEAHGAPTGGWTLKSHDDNHWHRMASLPPEIRKGVIEWTRMLEEVTGFELSRLSFYHFDMDSTYFVLDRCQQSIDIQEGIRAMSSLYSKIIAIFKANEDDFVDYHLVLIFSMFAAPDFMQKTFGAFTRQKSLAEYQNELIMQMNEGFSKSDNRYDSAIHTYESGLSITHNVVRYHLKRKVVKDSFDVALSDMIAELMPQVGIFKWTRNQGLKMTSSCFEITVAKGIATGFIRCLTAGALDQGKENVIWDYLAKAEKQFSVEACTAFRNIALETKQAWEVKQVRATVEEVKRVKLGF